MSLVTALHSISILSISFANVSNNFYKCGMYTLNNFWLSGKPCDTHHLTHSWQYVSYFLVITNGCSLFSIMFRMFGLNLFLSCSNCLFRRHTISFCFRSSIDVIHRLNAYAMCRVGYFYLCPFWEAQLFPGLRFYSDDSCKSL